MCQENSTATSKTQILVHCDFGWQGFSNGYYTSGIFDLQKGAVETESHENELEKRNLDYDWGFHVITYSKP